MDDIRLRLLALFRPRGLTRMLFEEPIARLGRGFVAKASYEHRYRGPHTFGVICGKPIPNPIPKTPPFEVSLTWSTRDGVRVLALTRDVELVSSWYDGPQKNGFSLLRLDVPQQLPLRKELNLSLHIPSGEKLEAFAPTFAYCRNVTSL